MDIIDVKVELNHSLARLKNSKGALNPSDISSDIIINAALKILTKIYSKELSINDSVEEKELKEVRRVLTREVRNEAKDLEYIVSIVEIYLKASNRIIVGLNEGDLEYLKQEIFKLVKHYNPEEIISNYYISNHGFNPFNQI